MQAGRGVQAVRLVRAVWARRVVAVGAHGVGLRLRPLLVEELVRASGEAGAAVAIGPAAVTSAVAPERLPRS